MPKINKVFGLEDWLPSPGISNRKRTVKISIDLSWLELDKLRSFKPAERIKKKHSDLAEKLKRLLKSEIFAGRIIKEEGQPVSRINAEVPYAALAKLAKMDEVWHIWIRKMSHAKKKRPSYPERFWCVRMTVVIQIEGVVKGMQTTEDRMALVKARSADEALKKVEKQRQAYESEYLNSDGQVVRWNIESFNDCYGTDIYSVEDLNSTEPIEVYSRLDARRLKKGQVWDGKSILPISYHEIP